MLSLGTSTAAQACLKPVIVASNVPPAPVDARHTACNSRHDGFAQACKVDSRHAGSGRCSGAFSCLCVKMYRRNPPGLHVRSLLPPCHEVCQVSQISSAGELQAGFTLSLHASPALQSSMWWTCVSWCVAVMGLLNYVSICWTLPAAKVTADTVPTA